MLSGVEGEISLFRMSFGHEMNHNVVTVLLHAFVCWLESVIHIYNYICRAVAIYFVYVLLISVCPCLFIVFIVEVPIDRGGR